MQITIFIGSARKGHTWQAALQLADILKSLGDVDCELIRLSEYRIAPCRGCITCFDRGEENCPLDDDCALLVEKMHKSDAVIFAVPNYSFHVSSLMKIFIDRIAYNFHRPAFFGKITTAVVTQGFYGGKDIVKYFKFAGKALGFIPQKGTVLSTAEPIAEKTRRANTKKIETLGQKLYKMLHKKRLAAPSLFDLMIFRMSRTRIRKMLGREYRDYTYYEEKGWFESDFYYPVRLGPFKKLAGKLFDSISRRMVKG